MRHLVNRTAIHVLSQNHRIRDKMLHACTSRGATCTAKQGRIVDAKLYFWKFFQFFFYPNGTWTHPPTSKLFLDFWNFFNFAKPLRTYVRNKVVMRYLFRYRSHYIIQQVPNYARKQEPLLTIAKFSPLCWFNNVSRHTRARS